MRSLARRLRRGFRRGITQFLQNPSRPFGPAVDEQPGRLAQGGTAEIISRAVALDPVKKRGDLDQPRPHGNEPVIHNRPRREGGGTLGRGLGHGRKKVDCRLGVNR